MALSDHGEETHPSAAGHLPRRGGKRVKVFHLADYDWVARRLGVPVAAGAALAPPPQVAGAVEGLAPALPGHPQDHFPSEDAMFDALELADMMPGELPAWHAGRDDPA